MSNNNIEANGERGFSRLATWGILAGLIVIVVAQGVVFRWEPVDDAYISFRFAENWSRGAGVVFNCGERVEGYTNFLWTACLAGLGRAGVDIPRASVVVGLLFASLGLLLTYRLGVQVADERGWPRSLALAAPVMLACYPGWSFWGYSGMEGPMLTCFVLAFILFACRRGCGAGLLMVAGVFGVLAALTRWEAVIVWPVVVLSVLFDRTVGARGRWVRTVLLSAILVVGFGGYFLWRLDYYGQLLPNTFYAKMGVPLMSRVVRGAVYSGELAISWMVLLSVVVWVWGGRGRWSVVLLALMGVYIAYVTWTGGDHFPWLRFYLPVLPVAAIMLTELVHRLASVARRTSSVTVLRVMLTAVVSLTIAGGSFRMDYRSARSHLSWVAGWKQVGQWAKSAFPSDYCLALAPVGAAAYYSDHPTFDMLGLTDRQIARSGRTYPSEPPGHQRFDTKHVLDNAPQVILGQAAVFSHRPTVQDAIDRACRRPLKAMYRMPRFQQLYTFRVAEIADDRYLPYWTLRTLPTDGESP